MVEELPGFIPQVLRRHDVSLLRADGGQLIQTLLDDAFAQDKRVRLNVLQVNTRAYQLYRRLGFTEVIREGVTPEIRIWMQAQPPRLPEAGPTDR